MGEKRENKAGDRSLNEGATKGNTKPTRSSRRTTPPPPPPKPKPNPPKD